MIGFSVVSTYCGRTKRLNEIPVPVEVLRRSPSAGEVGGAKKSRAGLCQCAAEALPGWDLSSGYSMA